MVLDFRLSTLHHDAMARSKVRSIPILDGIQIDRDGSEPLYLQLARALRSRVEEGRIQDGAKLPSTRIAAAFLGLHRSTVIEAYHQLQKEGLLRSGVGAGTFLRRPAPSRPPRASGRPAGFLAPAAGFWSHRGLEFPRPETTRPTSPMPAGAIRLTSPTADPESFPVSEFRDALDSILDREGPACLDYGAPDGYGPLREIIADRLARQGVHVDAARVILVNGSQQGLELLMRLLIPRSRTLLVEEPTYQLALRTARALSLPIRGIPLDAEGLRIDVLETVLDEVDPGMLYTMPIFQNPTGLTLSPARRAALLHLAAARGLPVVEDHFDAELDYRGDAPPPLLAEGDPPNVILLGTFSKILFPGLRIGWIVVPEALVGPLSELKVCADLSSGLLTQMAVTEFCRRGALDTHLRRVRDRNRGRVEALLDELERSMPEGTSWTRPTGGMTVWLKLPPTLDSDRIAEEAQRRGVVVNPGTAFYPNGGGRDGLRISYIREDESRIREGVRILGSVIRDSLSGRVQPGLETAAEPML